MSSTTPMTLHRSFVLLVALALALAALAPMAAPRPAQAVSTTLVISQVYGGGGNAGATLTHDFIEIFNRGTTTVDVSAWSVQYASAGGTSWQVTNLSGSIPPGGYYLVQEAQGAGGTTPLPTPDATGTIPMSGTAGKVALLNTQTALAACGSVAAPCMPNAAIIDFVGYGTTATEFEGAGPTPTLSNTTAAIRNGAGATDTDSNNADFAVGTPNPRNSHGDDPSGIGAATPSNIVPGEMTLFTVTVTPGATPTSTGLTVETDLSQIGGSAAQGFFDDASNGDATAGDNVFSFSYVVPAATPLGAKSLPVVIEDAQGRDAATTISLNVIAPVEPTEIHEIQGAGHTSPLVGQDVFEVEGIVTAVRPLSFYMTDPTPDGDDATSDGILVFRGSAPGVAVGDSVLVDGRVAEFRAGFANLSTTQLTNPGLSIQVGTHDHTLPVTIVGTGGRVPPGMVIDNDSVDGSVENAGGTFDPAQDGIDFWESLEGQYLRINDAIAVGPTNNFGEIAIVGDDGANAGVRTPRGGVLIGPDDFNPERVIIDGAIVGDGAMPDVNVGDGFSTPVLGVLDYDFGNFKLLPTTVLVRVDNGLEKEATEAPERRELSIATFNVENLDPNPSDSDGADDVARLGALIAQNLAAPDIVAIEEVQDNNGTVNDGTVAADLTWASLIAAVELAGGPTYEYRQIDPVNNAEGGAGGGNIRVGFLFRTDRGLEFVDRPGGTSILDTEVIAVDDRPHLSFSPGRIGTDARAFNDTRKSLAGEFRWRGQTVFVIANHFSSKNGDQPLFGRFQPPVRISEFASPDEATDPDGWRHGQAAEINDFVDQILAVDPKANVVVLGDINDFQFSETAEILTGVDDGPPVLATLIDLLPANERYSYVFDGNSQVLDQILVSPTLLGQSPEYDVVHVNSEFFDQASDHEPSVMRVVPGRGDRASGG